MRGGEKWRDSTYRDAPVEAPVGRRKGEALIPVRQGRTDRWTEANTKGDED